MHDPDHKWKRLFISDDSVNVPSLTPKKLMAYKRGMAFKKAMALAAFQQIPTEEDDLFVQSSLPQTIAEEDPDQLPPGMSYAIQFL